MEITSPSEECCVCGRQLAGSRWVKGSNRLKHSGRAVTQALEEVLMACETFVQLTWVCFRCYRLVLGLDYHAHQLQKQRLALLRLYEGRDKTATVGGKTLHANGDGGSGGVDVNSEASVVKESVSNGEGQKLDQACDTDSKVLSYPLQTLCDHEYHKNNDPVSVSGHHQHCTESLISGALLSVKDSITKSNKLNSDNSVLKNHKYSTDTLKQGQKNLCIKQEEIAMTPAAPSPQRLVTKRRKTAKKWDDFEYYEDENKNTETECDKIDPPPSVHQFRLPPKTIRKKCHKCKQEFATKKAILNHKCNQMKRMEREKVRYKCKGCLHVFLLRREYIKHVNVCYKNTPVTCNLCLVKLPSAAYLPRHLAALHQVKSNLNKGDILCELCGRGFSRKEALERHEARVHGKAHGSHQCSLCGHTFPHTSLLAEHLRAHQGYTCPECSKVFSCRSNLSLHRRAHHMRKAAYHCTACNRHWKFHASYIYHMKKFHRCSEYKCAGCRLLLYSEEALRQHSLTCVHQGITNTQSIRQKETGNGGKRDIGEAMKQTSDKTPDSHLGTDSLVKKIQMYEPQKTFPLGPPTCEIVVEVLEETDADCEYIILVEDVADTHLSIDDASMWNTQRH